ncbi:MAG: cob(I)yrinic acid a,c-diamide adenosyltransferase [Thermoanaerobaculia bacterium]|nr:cob(I)yrinic acid a,c-diamide adenosyltransferase [Thermoanaerobaculia bacterium]
MPRITKVYTRTGDDGTTALAGGQRLPKDALRVDTYGTVDELNASIGVAVAAGPAEELLEPLATIQNKLFHLGAELSLLDEDRERLPGPRITAADSTELEELMDRLSEGLAPLENFVLPGGTSASAELHLARTICRRAERGVVALRRDEGVGDDVLTYLNRLSDALFVMARFDNAAKGVEDVLWDSRA